MQSSRYGCISIYGEGLVAGATATPVTEREADVIGIGHKLALSTLHDEYDEKEYSISNWFTTLPHKRHDAIKY